SARSRAWRTPAAATHRETHGELRARRARLRMERTSCPLYVAPQPQEGGTTRRRSPAPAGGELAQRQQVADDQREDHEVEADSVARAAEHPAQQALALVAGALRHHLR